MNDARNTRYVIFIVIVSVVLLLSLLLLLLRQLAIQQRGLSQRQVTPTALPFGCKTVLSWFVSCFVQGTFQATTRSTQHLQAIAQIRPPN